VIVGSFNRIEVWDQNRYHQYVEQLENQAEQIAEQIDVKN
jgi:DNA-binding transcriptional regulator/RsmH inhibitor MraZ